MVAAFADPRVGIVAPRTVDPQGNLSFSLRRDATLSRTWGALVLGAERAGRHASTGEIVADPAVYDVPGAHDWASGSALLVSRACLDAVGRWDESFFLYSEETEFSLRARDAGFLTWYVPDAVVEHVGGAMSTDPWLWSMVTVNRLELYRRRHGPVSSAAYTGSVALYEASRSVRGSEVHRAALRAIVNPAARPQPSTTGTAAGAGSRSSAAGGDAPLPGDWDGVVVICAATPWDGTKFQDRHLAEHLSKTMPVLYVDPPFSPLVRWRKPDLVGSLPHPRLRLVTPTLARLTVVGPPYPLRLGVSVASGMMLRRGIARALASMHAKVRAIISSGVLVEHFGGTDAQLRIFWAQDDLVGAASMVGYQPWRIDRSEQSRARMADVIVASNPDVADTWRSRGYDPVLIPFGCDAERFAGTDRAPLPDDVTLEAPIAGFVGGLTPERIDPRLLEAVADRGHSLLLVGPEHRTQGVQGLEGLLARDNVQWVGNKPFEELPSYLRLIDVGLVPYADTAFNRGSFPLKTLEYLAAGKAVVSTDLPAARWLDTDLVRIESEPAAFAAAVDDLLPTARDPELVTARKAFAQAHSWESRARDFADLIRSRTS
jgi:glycosyltransferase involved in cell wall biosynthesis